MIEVLRCDPSAETLEAYAAISPAFEVTAHCQPKALDNGAVVPMAVNPPYLKDEYEDPRDWGKQHNLAKWALFLASEDRATAGACAVVRATPSLYFPVGPDDALLWDIRVSPVDRGHGVGKALMQAATGWALDQGCITMLIETQDTNVSACRLYLAAGFQAAQITPGVYDAYPDELLVVFRKTLT